MSWIDFNNDITGAHETAKGSDGRLNVSARSDSRDYYNSRDKGQCYALSFAHAGAVAGEYSVYLKNTSTDKTLVISTIELNSVENSQIKIWEVTGTATGPAEVTPKNLNLASSNDATVQAMVDDGTAISGLTVEGTAIEHIFCSANSHENAEMKDRLRLGQNDAIALEYDAGTTGLFAGTIFFYLENE